MPDETAYIDTSVIGAYYCPELLSSAAETALRAVRSPVISPLVEVEFCSLVAKKRRLRELTERQARSILDLFGNHVAEGFYHRIEVTTDHFLAARRLVGSMQSPLHTLDGLHLAAALSGKLPLVTADQQLAKAARRHKNPVILVR